MTRIRSSSLASRVLTAALSAIAFVALVLLASWFWGESWSTRRVIVLVCGGMFIGLTNYAILTRRARAAPAR
jgi:hypothetical protein